MQTLPLPQVSARHLAKRCFDLAAVGVGLILLLPVFAALALAVKVTSKGPVFYRQLRVGRDGTPIHLIKFRSMKTDAEAQTGEVWAAESRGQVDPRVTPVGNFLRKSHLDELPQLFQVFSGSLSLVGPRPERPGFAGELAEQYPFYDERLHLLPPGLTGLAQLNRERDETQIKAHHKLIGDHAYGIQFFSRSWPSVLWLDTSIILATIWYIFNKGGPDGPTKPS